MQLPELMLDWFFPRRCVVCRIEGSWACLSCLQNAVKAVDQQIEQFELEPGLQVNSLLPFELQLVRELLHHLKYNGIYEVTDSFLELLMLSYPGEVIKQHFDPQAVIIPVPTSRERLRQRGYNQAALLAKTVGKWLDFPVNESLLIRNASRTQVGKTAVERAANLTGSFSWKTDAFFEGPIILFDDLCTTGSTLRACAQVIRANTVSSLTILSLARKH